ncbi:MAG: 3-keto-disaccharide hydrolase [Thermoguttaceae bacterium]
MMTHHFLFSSALLFIISIFSVFHSVCANESVNEACFPVQELGIIPPLLTDTVSIPAKAITAGEIALFDGRSLFGWTVIEGDAAVQNGKIVAPAGKTATIKYNLTLPKSAEISHLGSSKIKCNKKEIDGVIELSFIVDDEGISDVRLKPRESVYLFDGKTLEGWKVHPASEVVVQDETFLLTSGSGSLEYEKPFGDFLFQFEYKTPKGEKSVNSGAFFRCIPGEKMNGYECQILTKPSTGEYKQFLGTDTGGLFRRQVGRRIPLEDDTWIAVTIYARGGQFATWVNGIQVTDWTDKRAEDANPRKGLRLEPGTIQFQGHDPATRVQLRNIRILPF